MAFYCDNWGRQLQWKAGRRAPLHLRLQSLFSDPLQQRARKWIPGQYKIRELSQVFKRSMKYAPAAMLPLVAKGLCLDSKPVNGARNQIDMLRSSVGEAAILKTNQVIDTGPKMCAEVPSVTRRNQRQHMVDEKVERKATSKVLSWCPSRGDKSNTFQL